MLATETRQIAPFYSRKNQRQHYDAFDSAIAESRWYLRINKGLVWRAAWRNRGKSKRAGFESLIMQAASGNCRAVTRSCETVGIDRLIGITRREGQPGGSGERSFVKGTGGESNYATGPVHAVASWISMEDKRSLSSS
ncbi:hypothetical protein KM043_016532 [Ampulex compressa]|nr:hypothetical protein KM043_016532 [Ampulex compressa]